MNEEKISVIVPTYNNENSIRRCIDSIINQNYKNLEIIVINDGSTDNTKNILEEYKKEITVYEKVNEGVSSARNLGIQKCNAEYLLFVDADDYLEPEAIKTMYNEIITTNSDIVMGNVENSNIDRITIEDDKYEYIYNRKIKFFMVQWNKLMKKKIFKNLTYPNIHIAEDDYMIYHLLENVKKITFIGKKTYNYCLNINGITANRLNYYQEILYVFKDRYNFFEKTKYKEEFYKLYMNYYIFLYCEFRDKNIKKHDIVAQFRKELKNKPSFKYMLFYCFPNLYYNLYKIRRRICKKRYQ